MKPWDNSHYNLFRMEIEPNTVNIDKLRHCQRRTRRADARRLHPEEETKLIQRTMEGFIRDLKALKSARYFLKNGIPNFETD